MVQSTFRSQNAKSTRFSECLEVKMSKKCAPLKREAHFPVKMFQTPRVWTIFGSGDVEKVQAVVARSRFRSQNGKSTACSVHFSKLRCGKNFASLWREAHVEVFFLPFSEHLWMVNDTTLHYNYNYNYN